MTSQVEGVTFIGIPDPSDGTEEKQQEFMARMRPQVSHILDDPIRVWQERQVLTQPSMIFIDADGTATLHSGSIDAMDLLNRAKELAA